MHSRAAASPLRAAATTAVPSPRPRASPRRSSARPAARYSSEPWWGWRVGARRRAVGEVGGDDDVAELGRGAGGAAVDAPVDDDAAADAGADGDHHERAGDEVEVVVVGLGERGDGRVVVDEGRDP